MGRALMDAAEAWLRKRGFKPATRYHDSLKRVSIAFNAQKKGRILNRTEPAMREYCRAIDLGVESLGVTDARARIDALYEQIRARLDELEGEGR